MASIDVPAKYVPLVFRLARARKASLVLGIVLLYAVAVGISVAVLSQRPGFSVGVALVMKVIGAVGGGMAVGVLILSGLVSRYSVKKYLDKYRDGIDVDRLRDYHGTLKSSTSSVLEVDVGAILGAIAAVVGFVGTLLGGT